MRRGQQCIASRPTGSIYDKRDNAGALIPQLVKFRDHQEQMAPVLNRGPSLCALLGGGTPRPRAQPTFLALVEAVLRRDQVTLAGGTVCG
jgi:hypothetical protein